MSVTFQKTKMIGCNYQIKQEVPKDENMASRVVLQRDSSNAVCLAEKQQIHIL
jgi:hypothetical protein